MKKIAILIYSLGSGGAERQVSLLLKYLSKKYKIYLVLMNDTIFYGVPENVEIFYLEKSNPTESGIKKFLKLPFLAFKYKQFLKEKKIDISLSFMVRPNYINSLSKIFGSDVKTILSERSCFSLQNSYKNLQSFVNKKLVKVYDFANLIIANSKGNALDLQKFIKKDVMTIYNMLDIDEINKESKKNIKLKKEKFTFITVGRIDEGKNHKLLIEAIKNIDANLWIIGDGYLKKELELKVKNEGLEDRILFLGRQTNPYKFLKNADCFVFSSNHEGFPNVLIEALACNLPIISTDCISGPREILAPNSDFKIQTDKIELADYGILTPIKNVKKMVEAMKMIYEDKNLRIDYSNKAKIRAKNFEIKNIIKEWEKIIERDY